MIAFVTNNIVENELHRIFLDSREIEEFKKNLLRYYDREQNPRIKNLYSLSIEKINTIKTWQKVHSISLIFSGLFIAKEVYYALSITPYAGVVSCVLKTSTTLIVSQIAHREIEKNIKELSKLLTPVVILLNPSQNEPQPEL